MARSRHVIRLRGPWLWHDADSATQPSRGGTVDHAGFQRFKFPEQLPHVVRQSASGCILLARDFGIPTRLTSGHGVILAIDRCEGCRDVFLNGQPLSLATSQQGVGHCEIAACLLTRNQLKFVCEFPRPVTADALPLQEVRLEIVEPNGDTAASIE